MRKRMWIVGMVLVVTPLLVFGIYVHKLHTLAMEGYRLFNDRCNVVSPLLIKTRNLHLGLAAALDGQATPSAEQFAKDLAALPESAEQYLQVEKEWLAKDGALINRRDFILLEPEYIKVAGKYQLAMYQGYYDYYQAINNIFRNAAEAKKTGRKPADNGDVYALTKKYYEEMRTNRDLYYAAFDKGVKTRDWRKMFAQVPLPDCPAGSLVIP